MIRIKGRFATYGEIWFDEDPPRPARVDVLMLLRRPFPLDGKPCMPFPSLVNDLLLAEEDIISAFGDSNRSHIKRAEKDRLEFELLVKPSAHLQQFSAFYDEFAQQKGLQPTYLRGLVAACDAGQLVLSRASREGRCFVWHAYVTQGRRTALLHSASHFRNMQHGERRLIARANRWLHWHDMLRFKQMGLRHYDWGGIFEDESDPGRAGINNFKREFGGRFELTYNCNLPVTLKGRAYLIVLCLKEWYRRNVSS